MAATIWANRTLSGACREILVEIARRRRLHFRLAVIHADVPPETVVTALREGRITSCGFSGRLTAEQVTGCSPIVGQMGTEPIIEALEGGADVIVAGRCCDAAIFAALPVLHGFDPAPALHLGKIVECGALRARPAGANDALIGKLHRNFFQAVPANPARRCLPDSVAAHSLYEQPAPETPVVSGGITRGGVVPSEIELHGHFGSKKISAAKCRLCTGWNRSTCRAAS